MGSRDARWYGRAQNGIVLASSATLREFITRIRRPKFDRYVETEEREAYIEWLFLQADLKEVQTHVEKCRDPDDDKFLELALSSRADAILSGDGDLKVLHPFRGIPILSPHDFLRSDLVK